LVPVFMIFLISAEEHDLGVRSENEDVVVVVTMELPVYVVREEESCSTCPSVEDHIELSDFTDLALK